MRAMLDVDWNLALARLTFLNSYVREMRKEIVMKNEKLEERAREEAARQAARQAPVPERPAHRRFWHRAIHRPAKPQAAQPLETRLARPAHEAPAATR